jgi:hypothetical protein
MFDIPYNPNAQTPYGNIQKPPKTLQTLTSLVLYWFAEKIGRREK